MKHRRSNGRAGGAGGAGVLLAGGQAISKCG